jgi:hypothetical protein
VNLSEEREALRAAAMLASDELDKLRRQTKHNRWFLYALAAVMAVTIAVAVGGWRLSTQQLRDREASCAQANSARHAARLSALDGDLAVIDNLAAVVSQGADAERSERIEQQRAEWRERVSAEVPTIAEIARLDLDCNRNGELDRGDYHMPRPDGLPVPIPE